MEFADKMRQLLVNKDLTQKEFATEIKMNYAHANKFFNGRTPNMEFIMKVVSRFPEIDLNWLLLPQDEHKKIYLVNEGKEPYSNPQVMEMVYDLKKKLSELESFLTQS